MKNNALQYGFIDRLTFLLCSLHSLHYKTSYYATTIQRHSMHFKTSYHHFCRTVCTLKHRTLHLCCTVCISNHHTLHLFYTLHPYCISRHTLHLFYTLHLYCTVRISKHRTLFVYRTVGTVLSTAQ